jgi:RNA-directed DNA polymerase
MTTRKESPPALVPQAQQAGAAASRTEVPEALRNHPLWRTAKPCVWTTRMLTTLLQGVEGGKWFRLFDKVFAERNLWTAFQQVAKNDGAPGIDQVSVTDFALQLPESLWELSDRLRAGTFAPQAIRRTHIAKPGTNETRPLGIPTVRDRVVQGAIVNVIEPLFEHDFAEQSYGFRPGRGCKDALRRVDELLRAGYVHVVDADLQRYFDSIPHDRLLQRLQTKIADGSVLSLIAQYLQAKIMEGLEEWTPEEGAPQGAVLSPLLSNVYLDPLDHLLAARGFQMIRYADDFVILCRTADEAQAALAVVQAWVAEEGLVLHPTKTKVVDVRTDYFEFLGYQFRSTERRVRKKSQQKLKDAVRAKTKRKNGNSLSWIIADLNRTLRGWFAYFQHSRKYVFKDLDQFIRQRLRAVLKKRMHRRGCAKGKGDMQRWNLKFFATRGLYSLLAAYEEARQSSGR